MPPSSKPDRPDKLSLVVYSGDFRKLWDYLPMEFVEGITERSKHKLAFDKVLWQIKAFSTKSGAGQGNETLFKYMNYIEKVNQKWLSYENPIMSYNEFFIGDCSCSEYGK